MLVIFAVKNYSQSISRLLLTARSLSLNAESFVITWSHPIQSTSSTWAFQLLPPPSSCYAQSNTFLSSSANVYILRLRRAHFMSCIRIAITFDTWDCGVNTLKTNEMFNSRSKQWENVGRAREWARNKNVFATWNTCR